MEYTLTTAAPGAHGKRGREKRETKPSGEERTAAARDSRAWVSLSDVLSGAYWLLVFVSPCIARSLFTVANAMALLRFSPIPLAS